MSKHNHHEEAAKHHGTHKWGKRPQKAAEHSRQCENHPKGMSRLLPYL